MPDTTDTANKLIDVASQKIDAFGAKMAELAHTYGPDIMNGALEVARIDALNSALRTVFLWLATIVIGRVTYKKLWPWSWKTSDHGNNPILMVGLIAWAITVLLVPISTINTSIWPFVGVIEPKLWLAHKLLNL